MSSGGSDAQLISKFAICDVQLSLCGVVTWGCCLLRLSLARNGTTQAHPAATWKRLVCDEFRRARAGKARRPATSPEVAGESLLNLRDGRV